LTKRRPQLCKCPLSSRRLFSFKALLGTGINQYLALSSRVYVAADVLENSSCAILLQLCPGCSLLVWRWRALISYPRTDAWVLSILHVFVMFCWHVGGSVLEVCGGVFVSCTSVVADLLCLVAALLCWRRCPGKAVLGPLLCFSPYRVCSRT
jgi:hypothetical protein